MKRIVITTAACLLGLLANGTGQPVGVPTKGPQSTPADTQKLLKERTFTVPAEVKYREDALKLAVAEGGRIPSLEAAVRRAEDRLNGGLPQGERVSRKELERQLADAKTALEKSQTKIRTLNLAARSLPPRPVVKAP